MLNKKDIVEEKVNRDSLQIERIPVKFHDVLCVCFISPASSKSFLAVMTVVVKLKTIPNAMFSMLSVLLNKFQESGVETGIIFYLKNSRKGRQYIYII